MITIREIALNERGLKIVDLLLEKKSRRLVLDLAKEYKKSGMMAGLSHMQKADKIVRDLGFHSWNHFCKQYKD